MDLVTGKVLPVSGPSISSPSISGPANPGATLPTPNASPSQSYNPVSVTTPTVAANAPALAPGLTVMATIVQQASPPLLATATVGASFPVRIDSVLPPSAAALTAAALPNATLLVATVIGASARGRPILRFGSTRLTLAAAPIPVGSAVLFTIEPDTSENTSQAAARLGWHGSTLLAELSSLPAVLATAAEIGGPTQEALVAAIPRLGKDLTAGLLYYLHAMRRGDIGQWLGAGVRGAIDRARGGRLMQTLAEEFRQMSQDTGGEWRGLCIPLATGERIEPIRLYIHRSADGQSPIRFLLDLDPSRLGSIQINGLAQAEQLDLIIRTPHPLPPAFQAGLSAYYPQLLTRHHLQGSLNFLVAPLIQPTLGPPPPPSRTGVFV